MAAIIEKCLHAIRMGILNVVLKFVPSKKPELLIGPGSSLRLAKLIATLGHKHVLLVTDPELVKLQLPNACIEALENLGLEVTIFDRIAPNPTESQINDGISAARQSGCDAVLAFGGGSSMDAAKVIAVGVNYFGAIKDLEGAFKVKQPGLPIFAVPTTAGTGSEVTFAAVVKSDEDLRKYTVADFKLLPRIAALDAQLMVGIPPSITAATGMDVLTHGIEAFVSTRTTPESRDAARLAVKLVFQHLATCCENGSDIDARDAMAYASYNAGVAIAISGVGYVHAFAHQMGGIYDIPHGLANAVILPHVLEHSLDKVMDDLAELGRAAGVVNETDLPEAQAKQFIAAVKTLSARIGIPEKLQGPETEAASRIFAGAQKEAMELFAVPKYMHKSEGEALYRGLIA